MCILPSVCGSQTAFYTSTLVKFVKAHLILILEDNSTFLWRFGTDSIIYAVLLKLEEHTKGLDNPMEETSSVAPSLTETFQRGIPSNLSRHLNMV